MKSYLSYEPTELAFGTSGLRGLVANMTDLECYINARGFLEYLRSTGELTGKVFIAGDLRTSTPAIMLAMERAIIDSDQTIEHCGFVPTPALAFYAQKQASPCIMVTGSHIPDDRNGIKFYKASGEVLKADEQAIKDNVAKTRNEIYENISETFQANGSFKDEATPTPSSNDAENIYVDRCINAFSTDFLKGKKVVVYQHSAVGRDITSSTLEKLGAEVVNVGRSEKFIPIDTENVTVADREYFKKVATENPGLFAIVSTDGDGDRPFLIDENGVFHRGDDLGALVATSLNADFAAYPISSSDGTDQFMNDQNIDFEHTKIGSPHVIVAMQNALSEGKTRVVGWEVNGGFLIGNDLEVDGILLEKLPTRDALLPMLRAMKVAVDDDTTVSEVFNRLPQRFTQAGMIDNFPVEISQKIIQMFSEDTDENRQKLCEYFTAEKGFGQITGINSIDGIRIYFENEVIAHIRPSGNAPQLRIYSVADGQNEADQIVNDAIGDPGGILRQLEYSISNRKD